jgi:hypothetical protein
VFLNEIPLLQASKPIAPGPGGPWPDMRGGTFYMSQVLTLNTQGILTRDWRTIPSNASFRLEIARNTEKMQTRREESKNIGCQFQISSHL